jgi:Ca2+-binding RTX toxin-like protein
MSRNKPNPHPNPQPNHQNYVIAPTAKIAEKTQSQLADEWWKYSGSIPQEDNPTLDLTGDFSGVNQSGDVYFLSGLSGFSAASGPVNRSIVVPQGKTIFIPIIGQATLGNNLGDTSGLDIPEYAKESENIKVFNLTIDGKPVVMNLTQAQGYRQKTQDPNGFSYQSPDNSVFEGTDFDNTLLAKSYQDGYYVGLNPLPSGKHTISFQAQLIDFGYDDSGNLVEQKNLDGSTKYITQNISYTIDVKPVKEIKGDGKNNNINGTACDDIIDAGAGNDLVYGGIGNDIIYGGAGSDRLYGDSGDDVVAGGLGDDKIYGGAGNDRLYGGSGNDEISGDAGNDKIFAGNGNDKIDGGSGDDVIDAVAYSPLVLPFTNFGGIRNSGQNQIDTIKGGAGRDTFVLGMAGDAKAGVTGSQYYVGGGDKDYALIQDFHLGGNGDKIQLYSKDLKPTDYVLGAVTTGLPNGVGIYTNDAAHDLVGIVQGQGVSLSTLSLTNNSQFNLVG